MRVLLVHPSALMYSEIFLRLEPLGLERVAAALLADGHQVRLIDLQVYRRSHFERELAAFRPDAVGFGLNYLANVPEVMDLAKQVKTMLPGCLVFAGGHSVSFVAEAAAPALLAAAPDRAVAEVPGAVTLDGPGRPPRLVHSLDEHLPARQCFPPGCRCPASTPSSSGPRRSWPASISGSRRWPRPRGSSPDSYCAGSPTSPG
jgi:hopanoid C-3 methylase